MARVVNIAVDSPILAVDAGEIVWSGSQTLRLPLVLLADGSHWAEAALFAQHKASRCHSKTVLRLAEHLAAYAGWLEAEGVSWDHFPALEKDRCLVRFRGALCAARDSGLLAPATVSECMAAVVQFYRWAAEVDLISPRWPMWQEKILGVRIEDKFGFEHTLGVRSSNLKIPNRTAAGALHLEGGLAPLSAIDQREIIKFADVYASEEFYLQLLLGFGTGMRIGTICDLRIATLANARRCQIFGSHGVWRLQIGPGADPPVNTKFGVTGNVLIHESLLSRMKEYCDGVRRLQRQSLSLKKDSDLVFLTSRGGHYHRETSAVRTELSRLRVAGKKAGISAFNGFHFHQSRATFLTNLVRAVLDAGVKPADALELVRGAALHKDVATTIRYFRFCEATKAISSAADAFSRTFLGPVRSA